MIELNKNEVLSLVDPYSVCDRHTDINTLGNYQYLCVANEYERNLSFERYGAVSNAFNSSRYKKYLILPYLDSIT
jgi:hypothetical protein